jgi:hypothetical protein
LDESTLIKKFTELVVEAASEAMSGEIAVRFERGAPVSIRKISSEKLQPDVERRGKPNVG